MFRDRIPILVWLFGRKVKYKQYSRCGKLLNISYGKRFRGITYTYLIIEFDEEGD